MSNRAVVALVGFALLVVGIVFGLLPVSASGFSCGRVFHGADPGAFEGSDRFCAVELNSRLPAVVGPLVVGGILLVGSLPGVAQVITRRFDRTPSS
jgi:hypothetical protein